MLARMLTRILRILRILLIALVTLGVTLVSAVPPFAAPTAQATTRTFASDGGVEVMGQAGVPYPATIGVAGLSGGVLSLRVTLSGLNYSCSFLGGSWAYLDILLVGPGGQSVVLFSDVHQDAGNPAVNLTFSDDASIPVPDNNSFGDGTYLPTDYEPGDIFPAPAPAGPHGSSMAPFLGATANGSWSLYVVSERREKDCYGGIAGWSITITDGVTLSNTTTMTFHGDGPADLYPSSIPVSGFTGKVNRATVTLNSLTHENPIDLDILLVNPAGQGVVLMSDALGYDNTSNLTLTFDDTATYFLPADAIPASGRYKPTNYNPTGDTPRCLPSTSTRRAVFACSGDISWQRAKWHLVAVQFQRLLPLRRNHQRLEPDA